MNEYEVMAVKAYSVYYNNIQVMSFKDVIEICR